MPLARCYMLSSIRLAAMQPKKKHTNMLICVHAACVWYTHKNMLCRRMLHKLYSTPMLTHTHTDASEKTHTHTHTHRQIPSTSKIMTVLYRRRRRRVRSPLATGTSSDDHDEDAVARWRQRDVNGDDDGARNGDRPTDRPATWNAYFSHSHTAARAATQLIVVRHRICDFVMCARVCTH